MKAPDVTYSSGTTLTSDLRLSLSQRAIFNATLTLNGGGFFYDFPITPDLVLLVNNGFTATTQNLLLRNFSTSNLSLGSGSSIIFGDKTTLQFLYDQNITQTLSFSGNSTIIGDKNTLNLTSGKISVLANANLKIFNLNLIGVTSLNFGCIDNTGSITFENVKISIPNRWHWSNGSMLIKKNMVISDGVFCYASGMGSTVDSNSKLFFSNSLNFSYDPAKLSGQGIASRTNLTFTNTTSWLIINNANLFVTTTGMQLSKGSLGIIGVNNLYSDTTTTASNGLCFGDGTILGNDMQITNFNSTSAKLNVKSGSMTYQNVESQNYLKYGDLFSLKNNTYGFYLGWAVTRDTTLAIIGRTLSSPNENVQFYAQQNDTPSRWGTQGGTPGLYTGNKTGQPVKSGDVFRFERYYTATQTIQSSTTARFFRWIYDQPSPTSSPNPPYVRAVFDLDYTTYSHIIRIYKKGGSVGEAIAENDFVYFVGYQQPNPGNAYPGSMPASFNTQSLLSTTGSNATVGTQYYQLLSESGLKEMFAYSGTGPVTGFPTNIKDNAVFQVVGVVSGAWASATSFSTYDPTFINSNITYDIIGGNNGKGYTSEFAVQTYLPAASLNQF